MSTLAAEITIEQLEALAVQLETDDEARRQKLLRMIAAYARILWIREPGKFNRRATHYGDEDGAWDSSYPPKMVWSERTGPRSISITNPSYESRATSSGFYHDWIAVPKEFGLAIGRDGTVYTGAMSGTGGLSAFAARPGDSGVDITIDWDEADLSELTTEVIEIAEATLRELAFPAAAQKVEV